MLQIVAQRVVRRGTNRVHSSGQRIGILHNRVAGIFHNVDIVGQAANKAVGAATAFERVVACTSHKSVVLAIAHKPVVLAVARAGCRRSREFENLNTACEAHVEVHAAGNRVHACTAHEAVDRVRVQEHHATCHRVSRRAQGVAARAADDRGDACRLRGCAEDDTVVAVGCFKDLNRGNPGEVGIGDRELVDGERKRVGATAAFDSLQAQVVAGGYNKTVVALATCERDRSGKAAGIEDVAGRTADDLLEASGLGVLPDGNVARARGCGTKNLDARDIGKTGVGEHSGFGNREGICASPADHRAETNRRGALERDAVGPGSGVDGDQGVKARGVEGVGSGSADERLDARCFGLCSHLDEVRAVLGLEDFHTGNPARIKLVVGNGNAILTKGERVGAVAAHDRADVENIVVGEHQAVACGSAHERAAHTVSARVAACIKGDAGREGGGIERVVAGAAEHCGDARSLRVRAQRGSVAGAGEREELDSGDLGEIPIAQVGDGRTERQRVDTRSAYEADRIHVALAVENKLV